MPKVIALDNFVQTKTRVQSVNDKILPNKCWFKFNVIPKYRASQKCGYNKIKESLNGFYN